MAPQCFAREMDLPFIERRRPWERKTCWGRSGIILEHVNLEMPLRYM